MVKQAILTLMSGNFEQPREVLLRIFDSESGDEFQIDGRLPASPSLLRILKQWQGNYREMMSCHSRLTPKPSEPDHFSWEDLSSALIGELNKWLNSGYSDWQKLKGILQQSFDRTDEILFIISTKDPQVQQLPWHLWDLFARDYPKAEVVFSPPEYKSSSKIKRSIKSAINVLAILGDSTGIDLERDRDILNDLPNAKIKFLVEPKRQELNEHLWSQGWDFLFFAGHSNSQGADSRGRFYINRSDKSGSIGVHDLYYGLRTAVENGLRLAIFNSCDGLGIAQDLAELNIPQTIVMREPVPDQVAHEFLKYFLTSYAKGTSFYLAVRQAREQLQGVETDFPCASWLPVIYQNPAEAAVSWQQLEGSQDYKQTALSKNHNFLPLLAISLLVTLLVVGMRWIGLLQGVELLALDRLAQHRPSELPDSRIIAVTVTEEDLDLPQQQQKKGSLSDQALNQLLEKLEQYKPRVIGLDIYRDFPVEPGQSTLATRMQKNKSLIAICKISDSSVKDPGVAPPPEISKDRLGFSDFATDPDSVLRRQFLIMGSGPTSPCTTPYSFSAQVAFRYLAIEGILPEFTSSGFLRLGETVFTPLKPHTGGYQRVDTGGHQILMNYRTPNSPEKIVSTVTLKQILDGQLNPEAVKDKIVLIGTTANSFQDYWLTPYISSGQETQRLPGVLAQAQMVSQVLSAVMDNRVLWWALPAWADTGWIFCCSLLGGLLAIRLKSPLGLSSAVVVAFSSLTGLSFGLLLQAGYWLPLVPSTIALVTSSSCAAICTKF